MKSAHQVEQSIARSNHNRLLHSYEMQVAASARGFGIGSKLVQVPSQAAHRQWPLLIVYAGWQH